MKIGAVFPQTEIGTDPGKIKEYAQALEDLGLNHILTFDHVLGGNSETHNLKGPYKHTDSFHYRRWTKPSSSAASNSNMVWRTCRCRHAEVGSNWRRLVPSL